MTFDALLEVRSVARVQAHEDFEYFANTTLGAKLDTKVCESAQRVFQRGGVPVAMDARTTSLFATWLYVIGVGPRPSNFRMTESMRWLFPEIDALDELVAA